ncbi:ERO1-like protein [Aureococcus anophagefferens]|nr:ERO1-like protein [Aureococcus anophagefferens]
MLANCAYIGGAVDECEFGSVRVLPRPRAGPARRDGGERTFELDAWARFDLPSEDYYDLEAYPEATRPTTGATSGGSSRQPVAAGSAKARRTCIGGICPEDDENGWRAVFDRSISGMHASIACHVVDDFSEDDDECLAEFRRRLQPEAHPERLRNLNFAFSLVLTALREARGALGSYAFEPGDAALDGELRDKVRTLVSASLLDEPALSKMAPLLREGAVMATECVLATDDESGDEFVDEAGIWQMRQRAAMLSAMDCVQCGACRLHGKVAWLGIATAMRIIYGDTSSKPLRASVAGLITALHGFGTAVRFAEDGPTANTTRARARGRARRRTPRETPRAGVIAVRVASSY